MICKTKEQRKKVVKAKREQRKWVSVPVPPTRRMLRGMARATFLNDWSDLEMERRFNGMLGALPKRPAIKEKGHQK